MDQLQLANRNDNNLAGVKEFVQKAEHIEYINELLEEDVIDEYDPASIKSKGAALPYDFALVFGRDASNKTLVDAKRLLHNNNFKYQYIEEKFDDVKILHQLVTVKKIIFTKIDDYTFLLQEAERMRLEKRNLRYDELTNMDRFSMKMQKFIGVLNQLNPNVREMEKYQRFTYKKRKDFWIPKGGDNQSEGVIFDNAQNNSLRQQQQQQQQPNEDYLIFTELFTPAEQTLIKYNCLRNIQAPISEQNDQIRPLIDAFELRNLDQVIVLHTKDKPDEKKDIDTIRQYYGETISFYFEFVQFMQLWLQLPIFIGLLVALMNFVSGTSIESSPYEIIFSLSILIWANVFYCKWLQHEKQVRILYRSFGESYREGAKIKKSKPNNMILNKNDPVTGNSFQYTPRYMHYLQYFFAFLYTSPLILLTIAFLIFSLNLRGYVGLDHQILMPSIYQLSTKGSTFDRSVFYRAIMADTFHVLVVAGLNLLNQYLAVRITKHEYHETQEGYDNSILWKRFAFELFSTFTDLSYVAFVKMDIIALRNELIILFSIDEIRRLTVESGISSILKYLKIKQRQEEEQKEKQHFQNDDGQFNEEEYKYFQNKLIEIALPEHQIFDDYLEIVINFGYLTLFASASHLAPLVFYFFHWLELKSDTYKIYNTYQRPIPFKSSGIGPWNMILNIMSLLCVVTNVILFAFSSDQIAGIFPQLFELLDIQKRLKVQDINTGGGDLPGVAQGRQQVLVVAVIEHFMFILIWIIRKYINSRGGDDWTDLFLKRNEYRKKIR